MLCGGGRELEALEVLALAKGEAEKYHDCGEDSKLLNMGIFQKPKISARASRDIWC